jgi:hypothetical protein
MGESCMRAHPRKSVIVLLGLCAAACSDATGESGVVALCPQATWAAIQREGEPWQAIPVIRSVHALGSGERIGLARIRGNAFPADSLQVYYLTANQAAATFACDDVAPTKELHGTVRGIGGAFTSTATIAMGSSLAHAAAQGSEDFDIRNAPNGPTDLVASAYDVGPAAIIRRGVNYPDGSAIPVLDFGSSEAFVLQVNTVTAVGVTPFEWDATSEIITRRGTTGLLRYQFAQGGTTAAPIYAVPANKLLDGELSSITVTGGFRSVAVFYRAPSDRTIELGPAAPVPTVTRSLIPPLDNVTRIDQASQAEYGSQITVILCSPFGINFNGTPTIVASKEYFGGTPATWSFTVPDFRGVGSFPFGDLRAAGLCGTMMTDRPYLAPARDGASFRSALSRGVIFTS